MLRSLVTDAQAALAGNQAYCLVSQVMVAYPDGSNLILCAGHCAEVAGGAFFSNHRSPFVDRVRFCFFSRESVCGCKLSRQLSS